MDGRRVGIAAVALGAIGAVAVAVVVGVAGGGSPGTGPDESGTEASGGVTAEAASSSGPGGSESTSVSEAPNSLAPAGPAPGGVAEAAEGEAPPAVAALASSLGCADLESQAHLAAVDAQATCRRGTERVYVMTFRSALDRDTYLTQGPQVVTGGFNVVGTTWVVHVETATTAQDVGAQLQGAVVSGP
jgi:hypothetical protein